MKINNLNKYTQTNFLLTNKLTKNKIFINFNWKIKNLSK